MHHSSPFALLLALLFSIILPPTPGHAKEPAAGGPAQAAPTQYPVVLTVPKLQVLAGGVTTTVQVAFTQTFAAGALETWGWTKKEGVVGLGDIKGELGGKGD